MTLCLLSFVHFSSKVKDTLKVLSRVEPKPVSTIVRPLQFKKHPDSLVLIIVTTFHHIQRTREIQETIIKQREILTYKQNDNNINFANAV